MFITAKIRYRQADGTEQTLEAGFTRYQVVFTGEELPDGRKADAVYIILSDIYMQVINGAMTRPLDYDYLKSLPPASQRFYELLSYRMYAALKNDRPRAKLRYSELCTYAPLVRQYDWNIVRPQLARIHAPHKQSGYLAAIDFQDTVDGDGRPDWIMLYMPGPKARAEYRAFARRGGPTVLEVEPLPLMAGLSPPLAAPGPSPLEAELIDRGITPAMAADLVRDHGEEQIRAQVEHLDWLTETKPGKVADPAAWLVAAIRNGHAAPKGFVSKAERRRREEARQAQEREKAEQHRRQREQEARDRAIREEVDAYLKRLTPAERKALEAEVLARAGPKRGRATRRPRPGSAPPCCWAWCGSAWRRGWGGRRSPAAAKAASAGWPARPARPAGDFGQRPEQRRVAEETLLTALIAIASSATRPPCLSCPGLVECDDSFDGLGEAELVRARVFVSPGLQALVAGQDQRLGLGIPILSEQAAAEHRSGY